MKFTIKITLFIFLSFNFAFSEPYEVFISPFGDDLNPGTQALPLRNLITACNKVVGIKTDKPKIVTLLGGTYYVDSVINLTSKHSATQNAPLIIRGKEGDTAILSGGFELNYKNSMSCDNNDFIAGINSAYVSKIRKWSFNDLGISDSSLWNENAILKGKIPQLYSNGLLVPLTQWPDTGYNDIDSILETKPFITGVEKIKGDSICKMYINNPAIKKWVNEKKHVFLHGYWFWDYSDNFEFLNAVDTVRSIVETTLPPVSKFGYRKGQRFRVQNLLCQLTKEGRWAVDPIRRFVYFWPTIEQKNGESQLSINNTGILKVSNCSNLTFKNITIKCVNTDAIQFLACTTSIVTECVFNGISANGMTFGYSSKCRIDNCKLFNIGQSAISVLSGNNKSLIPSEILIINNIIHDYAFIVKAYKPAIWLGSGTVGCRIAYNNIYNSPHSAIIFSGNNHNIENNYIYNVCTETQDAGVIYTGRDWTARGTVISNNYIKNCGTNYVNAIYIDDFGSGVTVKNNLFDNVPFGIRIGDGSDNIVHGNTVVNSKTWMTITKRNLDEFYSTLTTRLSAIPKDDSTWIKTYPVLVSILDDKPDYAKRNIVKNNTIVNSGRCNFISEADTFGIIDSGTVCSSYNLPLFSYGFQKSLDTFEYYAYALRKMPIIPIVKSVYVNNTQLNIKCLPSYFSNHMKAKMVNLHSHTVYNGSGCDTVLFSGLLTGDYVYSLWYSDIPFQDSTFSVQDTIHFFANDKMSNQTKHSQPENPCVLGGKCIDSTSVEIFWKVNLVKNVDFDSIGIWYSDVAYPVNAYDPGAVKVGVWNLKSLFDTVNGLVAGKLYYFSIFAKDTAGNWSTTSNSAKVQIRTGNSAGGTTGKPVILNGILPTSIFSDTLTIWGNNLAIPYTDTIEHWSIPSKEGFIVSGPAFTFRNGSYSSNDCINFAVKPSVANSAYTMSDVKLYRFNVNTNAWRLDTAVLTYKIPDNKIYFSTSDLSYPFAIMIDTLAPHLSASIKDTSTSFLIVDPICDTFTISDNIENPLLKLLAAPGSKKFEDISYFVNTIKTGIEKQYVTTIPAYVADSVSGLRSILTVSDGRKTDTINLSRKIMRVGENCDDTTIAPTEWTPLSVTGTPIKNSLFKVMSNSLRRDSFVYDIKQQRVVRWLPYLSNNTEKDKWVEYRIADSSSFKFVPGTTLWIKSAQSMKLSYDTAIIPALIDTFNLELKKGEWTDFSLPYNFDIYAGDILDATKSNDTDISGIELYEWIKSGTTYITKAQYLSGIRDASDPRTILKAGGAFSVYNNSDHDIILRIPPVCVPVSSTGKIGTLAKSVSSQQQWSVKLRFSDDNGAELSSIYCTSLPENGKPRFYKSAPSFGNIYAGVIDKKSGKLYGHAAIGEPGNGGAAFIITCENRSDQAAIVHSSIDKTLGLAPETQALLYFGGTVTDINQNNSYKLSIPEGQRTTGYLIVGTENYISGFIKKINSEFSFRPLTKNYSLILRYTFPLDVKMITISIFDLKGRSVYRNVLTQGVRAGTGLFRVDKRFASGYYIVQMKIETIGVEKTSVLNRQWIMVK